MLMMWLVAAAATAIAGGVAADEGHSGKATVTELSLGKDFLDVDSVAEVSGGRPSLLRGMLAPRLLTELLDEWTPAKMAATWAKSKSPKVTTVSMNCTHGGNQAVMRYFSMDPEEFKKNPFQWTYGSYDAMDINQNGRWTDILSPANGACTRVRHMEQTTLNKMLPTASRLAKEASQKICGKQHCEANPWVVSRGVGSQLHYDIPSNVLLHLHGNKSIVIVPPPAMLKAHVFPSIHPNDRQSQLLWTSATSERVSVGFEGAQGLQPEYAQEEEIVLRLQPGDVLFLPPMWGHQTFTSPEGPSVSLNYFLKANMNSLDNIFIDAIGGVIRHFARDMDAKQGWAALRTLGLVVVKTIYKEGKSNFLRTWESQTWRPQFPLLDSDDTLSRPLPKELCGRKSVSLVRDAAEEVVRASLKGAAKYRDVSAEDLFLRSNVGSFLEKLCLFSLNGPPFMPEVSRGTLLTLLVRSFAGCLKPKSSSSARPGAEGEL